MKEKIIVNRSVVEFAHRIATTLLESRSSTALFFVQQAYPDDVEGLEQQSVDDILHNVISETHNLLNNPERRIKTKS